MRPIDAHALWVAISNYCNCRDDALLIIDKAPTIDAMLIKHGRWIHDGGGYDGRDDWYHCSECNRTLNLICGRKLEDYPYCHCGAKMDGGAELENEQ